MTRVQSCSVEGSGFEQFSGRVLSCSIGVWWVMGGSDGDRQQVRYNLRTSKAGLGRVLLIFRMVLQKQKIRNPLNTSNSNQGLKIKQ